MPKRETNENGSPTPYDHFLYLLFELEQAVERGRIDWSAANSPLIRARLLKIAEKVAHESGQTRGGAVH
jgi:hypothetical protein